VYLVDLVLPRRCAVCSDLGAALCEACRASFIRLPPPLCERCGSPTAWPVQRCGECAGRRLAFATARAAVAYDDGARSFTHAWKERGRRDLAEEAASLVAQLVRRPEAAATTPVPPDPERGLRRGHHPAAQLASALARRWQLPLIAPLRRSRTRPRQRGLRLAERRGNVAGVFEATAPLPDTVVVVDDVYTSGATANAAASALRKAGARQVHVVTFARAIR
jgi:predicted amidophosphoribosyltransferase